jgi:hypothetical protein
MGRRTSVKNVQTKQSLANVLAVFFSVVLASISIQAQTGSEDQASPTPTPDLATTSQVSRGDRLINPGKIDFQYRHTSLTDEYNFIWWSPVLKGGFGFINSDTNGLTEYQGAFFRPLLPFHRNDDLIVGLQRLNTKTDKSWEFQTEYRFAFGLGVGGGFVRRSNRALDTSFGKISYRRKHASWNYILEAQEQKVASKTSLGGYGAVYDDTLMFTVGTDNEQWRASFGYIAKRKRKQLRPVLEILYVDNNIGRLRGPKSLFINGSLTYYGGFLSHQARLGRAMGPTGLEFGNPLGFLSPTWNRRLDVWELGDMVDYRLERITQPNGSTTGRYEAVAFPFQFYKRKSRLDRIFGGVIYLDNINKQSAGIQGGYFGKLGTIDVTVKSEYIFATHETGVSLGIIRRF